ncbi:hypothetical protein E0H26_25920 [Micromonospora zingiberis]|uniref:Ig-like domain-containing protein n=1 Tax=Micromonospora zingiberis TaxID=2053011 RepID=A0A4R0G5D8_9ACTN|nr:hypothetical protein [Micromonospora zingiberis]TCB91287.1 hypothetical protein E0H26_25920 [Micromonospora zingiberis]
MSGQALLRTSIVALTAALVVSGCASTGTSPESAPTAAAPSTPATVDPTTASDPTAAPDDTAASEPTADGTTKGGSTGGGSTGSTGGGQSGTKSGTGPTITYFRVAQKPSCPAGTNVNPIPGTPVVLEWKVSNVDSVALSVDGQGVYADNYPPTGSETLTFPCEGAGGDVQRHTYLLTVRNAHGKQTKTLVVTATVNEVAEV